MRRLIFSIIGLILTFIWIVYTAPIRQNKPETVEGGPIKKINKSGSTSLNKISQPIYKSTESNKLKRGDLLVDSSPEILRIPVNEKE